MAPRKKRVDQVGGMTMGEPLLEVKGLSVDFETSAGVVHAVRNMSFKVDAGETLAILGESGSGKSVTASAIMDLIDCPPGRIATGQILYRGKDILASRTETLTRQINGRRIAMIFQDPLAALNPLYTVGWQIAEVFRCHGANAGQEHAEAVRLLEKVGIPDAAMRVNDYPHQFSGGQRQRVVIAMAIALRPDLLIADEPTTALDVTVQAQILKLLKDLRADYGMGLLLITHDIGVVAEIADRLVVMKNGEIVEEGNAREVLHRPTHPYTRRLVDSVPGRNGFAASDQQGDEDCLVEVRDLVTCYAIKQRFSFRRATLFPAVRGVSFELRRGECVAVVGESGSGKSTLARTILGLSKPTEGSVSYLGRDVASLSASERRTFRRRIQAVFQDPAASLNPTMTASQIIGEPWWIHPDVVPRGERTARVAELLEQVGLSPEHAGRYPHQFSGGQRQRIAIARALALEPDILVCDEAVSSLDVSIQAQVIQLLKDLRRERGISYLFIAHDLGVVRDFADRVLVMHRGQVVEAGSTVDVFERPTHPYTRELLSATFTLSLLDDAPHAPGDHRAASPQLEI